MKFGKNLVWFGQNFEAESMVWCGLVWIGMVWYGLVQILKLNSKPLMNELMNNQGRYRAARAAKKVKRSDGS